jgi:ribosomal protein S18 acetylase RimI-like enzyme
MGQVVLETEVTNAAALRLYGKLGFAREERLLKYYLNGVDAFRLGSLCVFRCFSLVFIQAFLQTGSSSGSGPS